MFGLIDRWRLVLAATRDRNLSRGDLVVLIEVIERYYKTAGNSRASSRYLEKVLGIARRAAIYSLQRLRKHGYLAVARMGQGTRPTEYVPNFALAASGAADCTTSANPAFDPSGAMDCTAVVQPVAPLQTASGATHCTESYLPTPADKSGVQVSRTSDEVGTRGAASPPLPAASGAAVPPRVPVNAASSSRELKTATQREVEAQLTGFAELWAAFPRRHKRPQAKAAYAALAPDAATHAQLVAAAKALAAHYSEHNVEARWWPMLHNWLAGEGWLEDVPAIYADPKEAAIANLRGRGRHDRNIEGSNGARGLPRGVYHAKVVAAPVSSGDHACLQLELQIIDGPHKGRKIIKDLKLGQAYDKEELFMGRQLLSALCYAIGKRQVSDTSDFIGGKLSLRIDPELDGGMEFKPMLRVAS